MFFFFVRGSEEDLREATDAVMNRGKKVEKEEEREGAREEEKEREMDGERMVEDKHGKNEVGKGNQFAYPM